MSLTFVHTADWHLGRVYRGLGPRSYESARWRWDAVRNIFELADKADASFILVAGDVFDSDRPGKDVVRDAVELLCDAPRPVILISGNHDPCAEGSVWQHHDFTDALKGVRHVRLALASEPIEMSDCDSLVFPCPVAARHTRDDTTSWIPEAPRGGERFRIGLAHGGWKGYYGELHDDSVVSYNLIDNQRADRCGLDYLALGDYHSYTAPDHPAAKARTYYAGTPECGAADDARPGYALLVQVAEPGADPSVEPRFVGRVRPHDWGEIRLRSGDGLDGLAARVVEIAEPEKTLVRARIRGCLCEAEMRDFQQWLNETRERLLGADIDTRDLYVEPTDADFQALRLEPAEQRILELLGQPLSADDLAGVKDGPHIAAWSEDEAARREARLLFYELLREAK